MMHAHAVAVRHLQPIAMWLASVYTNLQPPAATDSTPRTTQAQGDQFDSPYQHLLLHMLPAQKDRCPIVQVKLACPPQATKQKGGG